MTRPTKIAIIGARGFSSSSPASVITCTPWKALGSLPNLRDYDTIIVNLLESLPTDPDWAELHKHLDITATREILLHNGRILVLGDPRLQVPYPGNDSQERVPFLWWTGYSFSWDDSSGDTVELSTAYQHSSYMRYLSALRRWDYSIESVAVNRPVLEMAFQPDLFGDRRFSVEVRSKALASNRYRNAISAEQRLVLVDNESYSKQEHTLLGPIVLLPSVGIQTDEALSIILQDVCGIEVRSVTPAWTEPLMAPMQPPIDEVIALLQAQATEIVTKLEAKQAERDRSREPIRLLYDTGSSLEAAVRDAFRFLGAEVREAENDGGEDGWVNYQSTTMSYEAVLEVKSTTKEHFDEYGLKQAVQWQQKGVLEQGVRYSPLFVGLASRNTAPPERPSPFGDSWVRKAQLFGVAAISTEDLYRAIFLHARGGLEVDRFWRDLAATSGLFDSEWLRNAFSERAGANEDPWAIH